MTTIGYATLDVIPSLRGIEAKLSQGLAGPMQSAGTTAGKTLGEHTSKSFGGALKGIGTLATGLGAYFVGSKINDFFHQSIAEARDAQKVTAQTNAVIKSTGGAANVSAGQIANLSNAISKKTGIDDEAIQSGANLLLTFRNVRNEVGKGNDVFSRATRAVTDMGAALGGDPRSSAIQLGKALNDPVKGVTALTRVGVTFDDQQKAQIKTLTESGHRLEAQKVILRELTKEFGGSAAAQATAGDKLKVTWQNFEEEIGTALLPVLDDLETWLLKVGPDAAQGFLKWFKGDGIRGLRTFGDDVAHTAHELEPLAVSLLHSGKDALPALAGGLKTAVPLVKTLADAFNSLPKDAQKLIVMGAGAKYLSGRLGGLNGVLPGFNAGLAGIARNGPAAGTGVGKFKSALGTAGGYAAAAFAIGAIAQTVDEVKFSLSHGLPLEGKGLPAILKNITDSGLGSYLDKTGVNVTDFAKNLKSAGDRGATVQDVLSQLRDKTDSAGQGFNHLGGWSVEMDRLVGPLKLIGVNLQSGALEAFHAQKNLERLVEQLKQVRREARAGKALQFDLATSINPAMAGLRDYRSELLKLPRGVLTKVETPGAVQSVKDVEKLAHQFKLQPHEVRTIMQALDFATPKIRKVMHDLDMVHHHRKPIPLDADGKPLEVKARNARELLGGLAKLHPTPKLDANGAPAIQSARSVLKELGIIDKAHPMAHVSVDTGAALTRLAYVRQQLDAIHSKTITVNIEQTGGAHRHAVGGYINGPGTGTSDSIPAMLSKGEFVINAAATKRHLALLQSINAQRFATGGQVGAPAAPSGPVSVTFTEDQFRRLEKVLERGSENGTARGMETINKRIRAGIRT